MIVIGVTGNIGSGKSTVCQLLAKHGATVIDADKLAHESYKPHGLVWQRLVDAFGAGIVRKDEEIDHQKLAQMVFVDPFVLAQLNRIVHPQARLLAQEKIEDCRRQGAWIVALEATLLIEAEWIDLVDQVWLVVAATDKVIERLSRGRGMTKSEIVVRLRSQMPVEEKARYADEIIYNDGEISHLQARVSKLWHKLQGRP